MTFASKVVTICCAVVALYILWRASGVLMLVFGAVLIATLLTGFARSVRDVSGAPRGVALTVSIAAPALLIGGAGVLFGPRIWSQIRQVAEQAPAAVNAAGTQLGIANAYEQLTETVSGAGGGQFFSQVAGYGFSVAGGATDLMLVLAAGVYLAANPRNYRDGVVSFFPPQRQDRIRETMGAIAEALRHWFLGQLVSMLLVGSLSGLAFWWIGLPTPIGLAVIAGLTNFVPIVGPLISAVPALLLAFLQSPVAVIWTAAAILVVQQIDGNVVMPIVQNRAVNLPPAVALLSILLAGAVFGILGVVFAAPLAVACMVAAERLWLESGHGPIKSDAS